MSRPSHVLVREHEVILKVVKRLETRIGGMNPSRRIDVEFKDVY